MEMVQPARRAGPNLRSRDCFGKSVRIQNKKRKESVMQDLINRVVQNVGIDAGVAQPAIGVVLNLLKSVLPDGVVSSLMGAIPGADALMSAADSEAGSGGITGMLGGALSSVTGGSTGAVTKALGQLQGLGLDTDTSKSLLGEVVGFAKEQVPPEVAAAIEENLPGGFI
jgi:hypothetical protein